MTAHAAPPPRWSTATFPGAADTTPMELSALVTHVSRCNGSRGRWFSARCAADAVHDFVASRFVTTLLFVATAVLGLAALVL